MADEPKVPTPAGSEPAHVDAAVLAAHGEAERAMAEAEAAVVAAVQGIAQVVAGKAGPGEVQ